MARDVVSAYTLILGDEYGPTEVGVYSTAEEAWKALDREVRGKMQAAAAAAPDRRPRSDGPVGRRLARGQPRGAVLADPVAPARGADPGDRPPACGGAAGPGPALTDRLSVPLDSVGPGRPTRVAGPDPEESSAGHIWAGEVSSERPAGRAGRRHRGRHAAAVLRRPRPGRLPAARRRRGHRPRRCPVGEPVATRGRGHRGPRPARGRQLRLRRLPDHRRRAARAGAGDRRGHHHPGRAGVLRAAAARRAGLPGHRRGARQALYFDQMDRKVAGRARPRRRADLPQPRVPRRHPRRARLDQRHLRRRHQDQLRAVPAALALHSGVLGERGRQRQGAGVLGQGRGPAVPRPRQHPARRRPPRRLRRARPARPSRSRRSAFYAPPTPDDLTGRPHVAGRTSGVERVLVDARRVLRRRAAAVRLRRRRGRAQPVHDGRPPGRRPAAAGRRRRRQGRRGQHRRRPPAAPTTNWSTSSSPGSPTTPPARDWAGPVTGVGTINASSAGCGRRCKPLRAARSAATCPTPAARQISTAQPAGDGRRPAQPAGARAAVRGRRGARRRDRPQGGRRRRAACCSP